MNKTQSGKTKLQDFLKLTAASGVTAVAGHLLNAYAPGSIMKRRLT
jgi:hypothetical protein